MEITNYITTDYKALDSQEIIATVKDFFMELNYSHFPVLEEGIFIGNIASDDVETFDDDKKVIDYKYTLEPFFTRTDSIWIGDFCEKPHQCDSRFGQRQQLRWLLRNRGHHEFFSPNSVFKRTRTDHKSKKRNLGLFDEPNHANSGKQQWQTFGFVYF